MRQGVRSVCFALVTLLAGAGSALAEAPKNVVSMNLCTDQLAMMLAGPGQLRSVSYLAVDPRASAMAEDASAFHNNRGLAEEIFLLQPDLVIAGAYSTKATVAMLKRLGVPVAVFEPAYSLADIRLRVAQMGELLHREDAARDMIQEFDAGFQALSEDAARNPRAVLYYANGYTSGDRSLAGEILIAAGFANAAVEAGYGTGGKLPLEVLALTDPEVVISGRPYPGASRSEEILDHPVVTAFREGRAGGTLTDHDWVCGTPFVLRAIGSLAVVRKTLAGEAQ